MIHNLNRELDLLHEYTISAAAASFELKQMLEMREMNGKNCFRIHGCGIDFFL